MRHRKRLSWGAAAVAAAVAGTGLFTIRPATAQPRPLWNGSWSAAVSGLAGSFSNETLREIVRTTTAGDAVRIRFTNALGSTPLTLNDVTVGPRDAGAALAYEKPVTFDGERSTVLPPGAETYSDPVSLPVTDGEDLAVSIYVSGPTGAVSSHSTALTTNYFAPGGDHTAEVGGTAYTATTTSWYMIDGLDVLTACRARSIVTLGDSITDGVHSTVDAHANWPSDLARRLAAQPCHPAVLNAGINGNRILTDASTFGQNAQARFDRDVLAQTGVTTVIFLEGINDIGHDLSANGGTATAQDVIDGILAIIRDAHEHGLTIIGGTLLPIGGSKYDTPTAEAMRTAVNTWIRTSGAFDGYIDFDKAIRDPADPSRILPAYNSGDSLHPGDAGYQAMANAIDLRLLSS